MKRIIPFLIAACLSVPLLSHAQYSEDFTTPSNKYPRFYSTSGMEGSILGTAMLDRPGRSGLTTPRYTLFLHLGFNQNIDFSNNIGMITGLALRNIGFIDKFGSHTRKHRIYGLTIPVLFKFGQMQNRKFFFAGAEGTLAVNYREKFFEKRSDKDYKFNEWFSDRTPLVHASIVAGVQFRNAYLKFSYYPTDFLNPDFVDESGTRPYDNYKVNLITATFGYTIPHKSSFFNF